MSEQDDATFTVVMNAEGQYSLWPADREIPAGWTSVGTSGPKAECLAYIEKIWTDLRPLSVRQASDKPASSP